MERRAFINLGLTGLGSTLLTANAAPAQYMPNSSKEKWAILYGTWYGTARDASVWISEGMGGIASVFDIRQVPANLADYGHLVIGTAIRSSRGPKALEDYIARNGDKLRSRIRGLFVVCGNLGKMPGPQQKKDLVDGYLAGICKVSGVPGRAFGGRITESLMPPEEYKGIQDMYAKIGGPPGTWDNLNRLDCLKLGKEIHAAKRA